MIRIWGRVLNGNILRIALADLFIFFFAVILAVFVRLEPDEARFYAAGHLLPIGFLPIVFFVCFIIADLYDLKKDFRSARHLLNVFSACAAAMLISAALFYSSMQYLGRGVFAVSGVLIFLSASLVRSVSTSLGSKERWQKKVLIVGAGTAGEKLLRTVTDNPGCGINIVGFVDDDPSKTGRTVRGKPVYGTCDELIDVSGRLNADIVAVCVTGCKNDSLARNLVRCHYNHITVMDMPSVYEAITGKLPLDNITDDWLLTSAISGSRGAYRKTKRLLDIIFSLALLYLSSPVALLAAMAVKLDSRGGLFYKQERVGMNFRKFKILKFRTMIHNADKSRGPTPAVKNDPRITRVGRIIRKLRIDEIPQLINVLMGDMSFVGPRPDIENVVTALNREIPSYGYRLTVKPGITGWAQVCHCPAATKEEFVEKLRYDLYYIKNMSIMLDLLIVLKTIRTVITFGGH